MHLIDLPLIAVVVMLGMILAGGLALAATLIVLHFWPEDEEPDPAQSEWSGK